jgi:hypothetical protein
MKWSSISARLSKGGLSAALLIFFAVLLLLLYGVFLPGQTLFSNDGPLGRLMSQCHQLPGRFFGCWADLNFVGYDTGAASPNISFGLNWILGDLWFSKFYALISLMILGSGAWCFFRQSSLAPAACILGGLAAMLNSGFFSVACWGVCAQDISAGMFFFALAALLDKRPRLQWLLVVLAGFSVGMMVAEGADVGAIFSLLVALFAVYQAFTASGPRAKNLLLGSVRLVLVVLFAGFLAVQTVRELVSTSIEGVVGTKQDVQTKADRWDWATQWSLPKEETLGLVVPGLFGYRMDTPNGGSYWGSIGRSASWREYLDHGQQGKPPSGGFARFTGGANYIGVLVALLAAWSALQSLRPTNSVFSLEQKKWLWFWLLIGSVSLMLAWGRYAPFYRVIYSLPYFSTIRNPTKFLCLFDFAVLILFAFGIDGLWRKYLRPVSSGANYWAGFQSWWSKAGRFDKNWVYGSALVWIVGLAAWYLYAQHVYDLERYLRTQALQETANAVANFSVAQPEWFALFFFLSAGLLVLMMSGVFMGKRAGIGVLLLGAILVSDLVLANEPWVIIWDYPSKYQTNPIIDTLRDQPYEHRVVLAPVSFSNVGKMLHDVYKIEWMQQQFPYYNIQTYDVVDLPRIPEDFAAFNKKMDETNAAGQFSVLNFSRAYALTDTSYLFAPADFLSFWNNQVPQNPLQTVARFNLVPKPGVIRVTSPEQMTAASDNYGRFALFKILNTVPRARLYTHWQVDPNSTNVLQEIFQPQFNPLQSVFVTGGLAENSATNTPAPPDDAVKIVSYAPKDIVLTANAPASSVLLLADHYHPDWKVFVDGQPQELLCCNFFLQGVHLLAGAHTVEFRFSPSTGLFYVSSSAVILALVCLGIVIAFEIKSRKLEPSPVIAAPATNIVRLPASPPKGSGGNRKAGKPAKEKSGARRT